MRFDVIETCRSGNIKSKALLILVTPSISEMFVTKSSDSILSTGASCLDSCGSFFLCMRLLCTCPIVLI